MPLITDLDSFITVHKDQFKRLKNYLWIAKSNYQTVTPTLAQEFTTRNKLYQLANNLDARIDYVKVALRHINAWVDGAEGDGDLHKVTLIPSIFAVDLEGAPAFDVETIKTWVSEALSGLDFVGVVEVAYFPRYNQGKPTVSWHVHAISQGCSTRKLHRRLEPIRQQFTSLVPGVHAAHAAKLPTDDVERWVLYQNKFPLTTYAPYLGRREETDPETVEVTKEPTGRVKVRKNLMRPGDMVRMCRVLQDRGLDEMIFGGGEGFDVAEAIKSEITGPWRAQEEFLEAQRENRFGSQIRR